MTASSNPFRVGSQGWCTLVHQNHAAGGENSSIMVGMFVSLCLASKTDFFFSTVTGLLTGQDEIYGQFESTEEEVAVLVKNRSRMIEIELAIGELHIVLQYAYWNSLYIKPYTYTPYPSLFCYCVMSYLVKEF
jgi:hypothetical protein